jgi:predicted RNA-binding protein YlxR (DUF448 family)
MRTCIGCRQTRPKKELLRVVRTPEGSIEVDSTGKLSGRGAYLCPDNGCFKEALKERALGRALGMSISDDVIEKITEFLKEIRGSSLPPS